MTKSILATCFIVVFSCFQLFAEEELKFGSKAPKLEVEKFLKGEPVKGFEKGKIYVVELWATWCGPCLATIPHLTELQKKNQDVTFIGVAVIEKDPEAVAAFVEEMGDKMDYRVALDLVPEDGDAEAGDGKTVKNWMEPAGLRGIPASFVVNGDGKIAWIGHPGNLEEPLAQIVSGKWDLVAEAKKYDEQLAMQKKVAEIEGNLRKLYGKFHDDGNPDDLLAALDSAEKDLPESSFRFQMIRFQVLSLSKDRADDAVNVANGLLESDKGEDPGFLNNLAWMIVTPERESKADSKLLKLALSLAIKADNLMKNEDPSTADTLAKAYFDNGDLAKAVQTQTRVVELAEGTQLAEDPGLKKRLSQYKRALSKSSKSAEDKEVVKPPKS